MLDFINNVDDGNGNVSFEGFCSILTELQKETDTEAEFKNAFRAFYKDQEGKDNDDDGMRNLAVSPQGTYQQRR